MPDCWQFVVNDGRYSEPGEYTIEIPDMHDITIQLLPKDITSDVNETARIIVYVNGVNEFVDGKRQIVRINHVYFNRCYDGSDEYDNWQQGKSYKEYIDEFGTNLDEKELQKIFG